MAPQGLLSLTLLYSLISNIKSTPTYCSSFGDEIGGGLEDLYVIGCIPAGVKTIYGHPVLIKATNDASRTPYNNFYYDARNMPQIPWGKKGTDQEVVYFLYDNGKKWQTELNVLKIQFGKEEDDILKVQIEGAYTSHINIKHKLHTAKPPKEAVASAYFGGNLMWSKDATGIQQYKTKNAHVAIDANGVWTLSADIKTIFNKYKNMLLKLLAAQKSGQLFKSSPVGKFSTYSYYYNPDFARGSYRWRVSRVVEDRAKIYAFPHTKYGQITYVKPDEYSYTHKGKKYTIKIRITTVDGSSKLVMWINDDKDEKVDGTTIYWDPQYGGECTRSTLNNVAGKNKYQAGSCSKLAKKLDDLKAKHVDRQIGAHFEAGTYPIGESGESFTGVSYIAVLEILHEEYEMIHFPTNSLNNVIAKQKEAKQPKLWQHLNKILQALLTRKDVKGLVVDTANPSHIRFARKIKSQATDKTKTVFDYWLNVDSSSRTGPVAMEESQLQLTRPGQWIVIVLDKPKVTLPEWFTDPKQNIFIKWINTWEAKREIHLPKKSSTAETEMSNMYDDITDYNIMQFDEKYNGGYVISELNYWNRMNMIILIGFSMMSLLCIGYLCGIFSLCVALFAYKKSTNSCCNDIDLITV